MAKKIKNKRIEEWKADKRAQRKANEHIPKAMKVEEEKRKGNALQQFKEKKKEQKKSAPLGENNNIDRNVENEGHERKGMHVPSIDNNKLKAFIEAKKPKLNSQQYIHVIPDTISKNIIEKYSELVSTPHSESATVRKLLTELKTFCSETSLKNQNDIGELNKKYNEFLQDVEKKNDMLNFEQVTYALSQNLISQVKIDSSDISNVIPNKDSFKEAQNLIKELVESYTDITEKLSPMYKARTDIRQKTAQLRYLADREESIFTAMESYRKTSGEKYAMNGSGNFVLSRSVKLLSHFRDHMIKGVGEKFTKNFGTGLNKWIKKLNKFILTEHRRIKQINEMYDVIENLQAQLNFLTSQKIPGLNKDATRLKKSITQGEEWFEASAIKHPMCLTVEQKCDESKKEIEMVRKKIQGDVKTLEKVKQEFLKEQKLDKTIEDLRNAAKFYEEQILNTDRELEKGELTKISLKSVQKASLSLLTEQEKQLQFAESETKSMENEIPHLLRDIYEVEEFNTRVYNKMRSHQIHVLSFLNRQQNFLRTAA